MGPILLIANTRLGVRERLDDMLAELGQPIESARSGEDEGRQHRTFHTLRLHALGRRERIVELAKDRVDSDLAWRTPALFRLHLDRFDQTS